MQQDAIWSYKCTWDISKINERKVVHYQTPVYLLNLVDIIVFSRNFDHHLFHSKQVFKLLEQAGLKLSLNECNFAKDKIDYLEHVVSGYGVSPNENNIQGVVAFRESSTLKELKSFLGLVNYYRRFIRTFAEKAHHLTKLTKMGVK